MSPRMRRLFPILLIVLLYQPLTAQNALHIPDTDRASVPYP